MYNIKRVYIYNLNSQKTFTSQKNLRSSQKRKLVVLWEIKVYNKKKYFINFSYILMKKTSCPICIFY